MEKVKENAGCSFFFFSVLDTLLKNSELGKPSQASELETKMCCSSVHCVS